MCGLQEGFELSREREAQAGELARVGAWVDSWIKFDHMASNYVPVTRFVAMMYVLRVHTHKAWTTHSCACLCRCKDTFVDVRFIAYTKDPDNRLNNEPQIAN